MRNVLLCALLAAAALAQSKPNPATCLDAGFQPPPDGRTPLQVAQAQGRDPRCCSGRVDDRGACTYTPRHSCGESRKCEGKRSCLDGMCCLAPSEDCAHGEACCPGLACKPGTHKCDYVNHNQFGVGGGPVGASCAGPFECVTGMCQKGKCISQCIAVKSPCGSAADQAIGHGCCGGSICLETKAGSGKFLCKAVGGGGCNQPGTTCDPHARRGSEGSRGNNCCGYCGNDGRCH